MTAEGVTGAGGRSATRITAIRGALGLRLFVDALIAHGISAWVNGEVAGQEKIRLKGHAKAGRPLSSGRIESVRHLQGN
ncbi:MAG: hypothetical protein ACO270_13845 [Burkholderiaceae bacterium]